MNARWKASCRSPKPSRSEAVVRSLVFPQQLSKLRVLWTPYRFEHSGFGRDFLECLPADSGQRCFQSNYVHGNSSNSLQTCSFLTNLFTVELLYRIGTCTMYSEFDTRA